MTLLNSLLIQVRSDVKDALEVLFTHGNIGVDSTASQASDTQLGEEVLRRAIDEFDKTTHTDKVVASLLIPATQANGVTIRESGFVSGASTQVESCDDTTGFSDSADMTVSQNTSTYRENEAALNLTKDGTGSDTASTSKTTTSVDFTSKDLSLHVYVKDSTMLDKLATTDCITIRFGSDSSNYYQWTKDKADLSAGDWTRIEGLDTSNADSTTGSPVLSSMDYFYIAVTATGSGQTWSDDDLVLDDVQVSSGTQLTRNTPSAINKTDDINIYYDDTITITVTEV